MVQLSVFIKSQLIDYLNIHIHDPYYITYINNIFNNFDINIYINHIILNLNSYCSIILDKINNTNQLHINNYIKYINHVIIYHIILSNSLHFHYLLISNRSYILSILRFIDTHYFINTHHIDYIDNHFNMDINYFDNIHNYIMNIDNIDLYIHNIYTNINTTSNINNNNNNITISINSLYDYINNIFNNSNDDDDNNDDNNNNSNDDGNITNIGDINLFDIVDDNNDDNNNNSNDDGNITNIGDINLFDIVDIVDINCILCDDSVINTPHINCNICHNILCKSCLIQLHNTNCPYCRNDINNQIILSFNDHSYILRDIKRNASNLIQYIYE